MKRYVFNNRANIKLLVFLSVALASCHDAVVPNSEIVTVKTSLKNASQIISRSGQYHIEFSPNVNNLPLNQYVDLDVLVKGATQQTLSHPVRLTFDAGMRAHNHGLNVKPIITALGKGKFKIEGVLLHMPGQWFMRFNIFRGAISDYAESDVFIDP